MQLIGICGGTSMQRWTAIDAFKALGYERGHLKQDGDGPITLVVTLNGDDVKAVVEVRTQEQAEAIDAVAVLVALNGGDHVGEPHITLYWPGDEAGQQDMARSVVDQYFD
jgi:hypothetical protein